MSFSNSAESNFLNLLMLNTNWANVGDAVGLRGSTTAGSFYMALHTADPGEAGNQSTNETAYTNYTRVAVARSGAAWSISGTAPTTASNLAAVTFPTCGATGASLTHGSLGVDSAGATEMLWYGTLTTSPLAVSNGIAPSYAIGDIDLSID